MAPRKNRNKNLRRRSKPGSVSSQRPTPTTPAAHAAKQGTAKRPYPIPALSRLARLPGLSAGFSFAGRDALALCLLIALCYLPATWGGFVWDDHAFTNAPQVLNPSGIRDIWFKPHSLEHEGHYWPLLYTTFWLEHKLWGLTPTGYHLSNLLLHAATTLLLWRLLLRLAVPGAWFAAAVFAVHPLHVESVAWIIGRKDVLAGLCSVACVHAYLGFVEGARAGRYRRYAQASGWFVAGLLCKSVVVTLPVSLLLWHWWKRGRVLVADVLRTLPLLALGLLITIADWRIYRGREDIVFPDYSLIEQALSAARGLWFYAGKLVWPTELAVIYPQWETDAAEPLAWVWLMAAVAVLLLLWLYRKRIGRGALAGVAFFIITLSPTLGFVQYGFMQFSLVADRYQYLAGAGVTTGLVAAAALAARRWVGTHRHAAFAVRAAATLLLAVLGTITWNQAGIYRDNFAFFSHITAINPQARDAYYNLAQEYSRLGRAEEALAAYRIAVEQRPEHVSAHIGAGIMATELKRLDEAEVFFENALETDPQFPAAYSNLAVFRVMQNRPHEALELFQRAIALEPGFAKAYSGRGIALTELKRYDEALRSFDRALELDPLLERARVKRAQALRAMHSETP